MVQDVTQDYTKENEDTQSGVVFDLENSEDRSILEEELKSSSMYFKPEEGVTYKVKLTSTKVRQVQKEFEGESITKYELSLSARGSDKSDFEGLWEVGKSVLDPIFKNYKEGVVFNISKTGSGKKTRYSVNVDF